MTENAQSPLPTEAAGAASDLADAGELFKAVLTGKPDDPLIEFRGVVYSRGWVSTVAGELEAILAETPPEYPIALVARNRPGHAAVIYGAIAQRRSISMMYGSQSSASLARDLRQLRPTVVIADEQDWSDEVSAAAADISAIAVAIKLGSSGALYRTGVAHRSPTEPRRALSTPAVEVLSSGTTGPPKRMPLTFAQLSRVVQAHRAYLADGDANQNRGEIVYAPFSSMGGVWALMTVGGTGCKMILMEKFTVEEFVAHVRSLRPKSIGLFPICLRMVLDAKVPKEAFASAEFATAGGALVDPALQEEFETTYGIPLLIAYGATEFCGSVVAWTRQLREQYGRSKLGSVGRPLPGVSIRVVDAQTGAALPAGEQGVIEALVPRIRPDWIRTTDLAVIDEDGFVFHRGRADGAISRGGFKIFPDAVAEALRRHPALSDACVVGLDDRRYGQVPVAVCEVKPGIAWPAETEMEQFARRHLIAQHIPVRFLFVDQLPRSAMMKVRIPEVKALVQAQLSPESSS